METRLRIRVNEIPNNLDTINAQFIKNGNFFNYTSGENRINKTFVDDGIFERRKIASVDTSGTLNPEIGDISGDVYAIKEIGNYLFIGGQFDFYVAPNFQSYFVDSLLILDKDTYIPAVDPSSGTLLQDIFTFPTTLISNERGIIYDIEERLIAREDNGNTTDPSNVVEENVTFVNEDGDTVTGDIVRTAVIVGKYNRNQLRDYNGNIRNSINDNFIEIDTSTWRTTEEFDNNFEPTYIFNARTSGTSIFTNGILSVDIQSVNSPTSIAGQRIAISGDFTLNITNSSSTLESAALFGKNLFIENNFLNNFSAGSFVIGYDIKFKGSDNQLYFAGDFLSLNSDNSIKFIGLIDLNGNLVTSFNPSLENSNGLTSGVNVRTIEYNGNDLYIGGNFSKVNGQFKRKLARLNPVIGILDTSFNPTVLETDDVFNIALCNSDIGSGIFVQNRLMVGGNFSNDIHLKKFNTSGLPNETTYPFNDTVYRVVSRENDDVWVGGSFIEWIGASILNDDPNYVAIGSTIAETIDNLFINLDDQNSLDDINYSTILLPNGIDIVYEFTDPNTLMDVLDVQSTNIFFPVRVQLTVENDSLTPLEILKLLLKRSDYVVKNKEGNSSSWNNADFNLYSYEGNINDYANLVASSESINKLRLSGNQTNQYLNLSPLVTPKSPTIISQANTDLLIPSNQGKFLFTRINSKVNKIITDSKVDLSFITDGYREEIQTLNNLPTLFINGKNREVISNIKIPFNTNLIDTVLIFPNNSGPTIINTVTLNPELSSDLISYVNVYRENYSSAKYVDVIFYEGTRTTTVRVDFRKDNCNYGFMTVYFVNKFGIIENIEFNGSVRFKNNFDNNDEYFNSVRDINGNFDGINHTNKILNRTGKTTVSVNTGIMREYNNFPLKDLMMSKQIWLNFGDSTVQENTFGKDLIPVKIAESNFVNKTRLINSTIDYTFDFEIDNFVNKNIL